MTKPIEGWVVVSKQSEPEASDIQTCSKTEREAWNEFFGVFDNISQIAIEEAKNEGWYTRPVQITFMDNTARDLIEDGLEDDTIATTLEMMRSAVVVERQRIYSELQHHIGEDSYSETDDGDREYTIPSDRCLRAIIFGEEK